MLKQIIDIFELLDRPDAGAEAIREYLADTGKCDVEIGFRPPNPYCR